MKAYEGNTAAYFATPPVNLIYAYHASLIQITQGPLSLQDRFKAHKEASRRFKEFAEGLGFRNVPLSKEVSANGMTAVSQFHHLPCPAGAHSLSPSNSSTTPRELVQVTSYPVFCRGAL